jgi:hypothetical protein
MSKDTITVRVLTCHHRKLLELLLLEQVTSLLQNPLSRSSRVFIQGFLPLDRLPNMVNE